MEIIDQKSFIGGLFITLAEIREHAIELSDSEIATTSELTQKYRELEQRLQLWDQNALTIQNCNDSIKFFLTECYADIKCIFDEISGQIKLRTRRESVKNDLKETCVKILGYIPKIHSVQFEPTNIPKVLKDLHTIPNYSEIKPFDLVEVKQTFYFVTVNWELDPLINFSDEIFLPPTSLNLLEMLKIINRNQLSALYDLNILGIYLNGYKYIYRNKTVSTVSLGSLKISGIKSSVKIAPGMEDFYRIPEINEDSLLNFISAHPEVEINEIANVLPISKINLFNFLITVMDWKPSTQFTTSKILDISNELKNGIVDVEAARDFLTWLITNKLVDPENKTVKATMIQLVDLFQ